MTGLGLLSALFLVFVVIQLRYLFGDHLLVQTTLGVTYAEYARQGFFELLAVAALLIPLLLGCDWLLGNQHPRRGFRLLAGLLMALLGLIFVSAVKRLSLYTTAYGLTELRLYAAAFLAWLAVVATWFSATVLTGRRPLFVGGTAIAALVALAGLHVLNPDAFIARHNLARARDGLHLDLEHLLRLGPDAAPVLLRGLPDLPLQAREDIRQSLERRWGAPGDDWRRWNLARERAHHAVIAARLTPSTP
jgi:hypothetical protein